MNGRSVRLVLLKKPYNASRRAGDCQSGPFPLGIAAEIIHVVPDGRTRNVSLYLYDTERREIFLGPNSIPEYVDFHTSGIVLYKRATEQGYLPVVPRDKWAHTPGMGGADTNNPSPTAPTTSSPPPLGQ